jgi:hypothetical protein
MTDHPTRRLPNDERPDQHGPAQPTHRLDHPLPPAAPQERCGRCGGPSWPGRCKRPSPP